MAGTEVTITSNVNLVQDIGSKISDAQPMMEKIGSRSVGLIQQDIKMGREPNGTPMIPDSSLTKEVKRGSSPLRDTGELMNSFSYQASAKDVAIGTNVIYASIHQEGGIISKVMGYLCIPLTFQARQVAKGSGGMAHGGSLRGVKGLFVLRSKKGNLFLCRNVKQKIGGAYARIQGKSKATYNNYLEFWAILKKNVKIPRRAFLPEGDIMQYPRYCEMLKYTIEEHIPKLKA